MISMLKSTRFFADDQVNLDLLRRRAYNVRWAMQPDGVIPLTAADPDFPVAPEIRAALAEYSSSGVLSYGPPEGLPEFRAAAASVMRDRKGVAGCGPEHIFPTDSAASAMYLVARFALNAGDEAIIFDPVDFLFAESVRAAGATPVRLRLDPATDGFDPDALERLITPRTRLIGVCNPHNPLGRVFSRQTLEAIGQIAVRHGLWIVSDEIWSDVVYAPHRHVSMAGLDPEIGSRVISVYGFSKTFGLAGLRVGFIHAPSPEILDRLITMSGARTTAFGVSTLSQIAATTAYEKCWYWADAFVAHLHEMRDYALSRLARIPGVRCNVPAGTYVLFPEIRGTGRTSEELATLWFEKARVAVAPGIDRLFGPGADGHLRICFSTSHAILREAFDRIDGVM